MFKSHAQHPTLTHLDKVFWPAEGYTKGDVIEYYRRIAPLILPYLQGRPQALHRYPNGIGGKSFYQKDLGPNAPTWLRTAKIRSEGDGRELTYLVCDDEATLLYLANLGCIEIDPWLSCIPSLDRPDFCLIDLDPEGVDFAAVVETALAAHAVLEEIGAPNYCKTSGATGLHICVPLHARYSYEQSRQFAKLLADLLHRRLPNLTSIERRPAKRSERVHLDFLQNWQGQTIAAPYCLRPRPGAPVSTPLRWDEVNDSLDPNSFHIGNIEARVDAYGDLWRPVLEQETDLTACLAMAASLR